MKKTIILDSVGLIDGFGDAVIDPHETRKKVKIEIKKDPAFLKIKAFKKKCDEFSKKSNEDIKKCQFAQQLKKTEEAKTHYDNFLLTQGLVRDTMEEMIPVIKELVENEKKLIRAEAVYLKPKKNEIIIEDDDEDSIYTGLIEKIGNLPDGKRLGVDGEEIYDNRGYKGYKKTAGTWSKIEINDIGVSVGTSKTFNALTDVEKTEIATQLEATRVSNLNASDKLSEKTNVLANAVNMAATMRSELEIQGESTADALTQATTWYDAEVVIIEAKYA